MLFILCIGYLGKLLHIKSIIKSPRG